MDRAGTLALWERCKAARDAPLAGRDTCDDSSVPHEKAKAIWNAWANDLIAKLDTIKLDLDAPIHGCIHDRRPGTETRDQWLERQASDDLRRWIDDARVTFEGHDFASEEDICFDGFIFPCEANFENTRFRAPRNDDAEDAQSSRYAASFSGVTFHGPARFGGARFEISVFFDRPERKEQGRIVAGAPTVFHADAWFGGASFEGEYSFFKDVEFKGPFRGRSLKSTRILEFDSARFCDLVWMPQASNGEVLSFNRCRFDGDVIWGALTTKGAFILGTAVFAEPPDLTEATLAQPPRLDDVVIPIQTLWQSLLGASWPEKWTRQAALERDYAYKDWDKDHPAFYRALRLQANRGGHYEREQYFFVGEVRAQRWTRDRLNSPIGAARLVIGVIYDVLAELGFSIFRPLAFFLLLTVASVGVHYAGHLAAAREAGVEGCLDGAPGEPLFAAGVIAWSNAIPLKNALSPIAQASLDCLHAADGRSFARSTPSAAALPLYVWTVFQSTFSAVLLFLFLLAVRNHFRIR